MKDQFLSQYSDNTRETYRIALSEFGKFLGREPETATSEELIRYQLSISHQANTTVAKKIAVLSSFFRFLIQMGIRADNPLLPVRRKKIDVFRAIRWLEDDEVDALLAVADKTSPRELAIVWLALHGLRVSEITSLNVNQFKTGIIWNLLGKGNKTRIVPLTLAAQRAVKACIGKRKGGPLLLAEHGNRLSKRQIQRIVYTLTEQAGKKINIHGLRHTYGTRATRRGVPTVTLAKLMGHASVATTQKYVHLDSGDLEMATEMIYPEDEHGYQVE